MFIKKVYSIEGGEEQIEEYKRLINRASDFREEAKRIGLTNFGHWNKRIGYYKRAIKHTEADVKTMKDINKITKEEVY